MTPLIERIEEILARRKKIRRIENILLVVGWTIFALCVLATYAMVWCVLGEVTQ